MKIIRCSRKDQAKRAADRWKMQYYDPKKRWSSCFLYDLDTKGKWEALKALGPDPDPDDVDRIIGNSSWTEPQRCDGCCAPADRLIGFAYHKGLYCAPCLKKAHETMEADSGL